MHFHFLLTLTLTFLSYTFARRCGTREPSPSLHAIHAEYATIERDGRASSSFDNIVLDTYVHVIANGSTPDQGNVPDQQVYDQITTINRDYANSGFSFKLKEITRSIRTDWQNIDDDSTVEAEMKQTLRQGGYDAINIYFSTIAHDLLGFAYFPQTITSLPDYFLDGIVADYRSIPGGSLANYNLGRTVTHELGHWFGLFHTFQNGCLGDGDHVDDTPAEASPAFGCPADTRDTCPTLPGTDPIHNFMDYSDDPCMNAFTAGQMARLRSLFGEFRANYTGPMPDSAGKGGDVTAAGRR